MTDSHEQRVRTALEGLRFPAGHPDVVAYVPAPRGIEADVLDAVDALPSRAFTSSDDVVVSLSGHA